MRSIIRDWYFDRQDEELSKATDRLRPKELRAFTMLIQAMGVFIVEKPKGESNGGQKVR